MAASGCSMVAAFVGPHARSWGPAALPHACLQSVQQHTYTPAAYMTHISEHMLPACCCCRRALAVPVCSVNKLSRQRSQAPMSAQPRLLRGHAPRGRGRPGGRGGAAGAARGGRRAGAALARAAGGRPPLLRRGGARGEGARLGPNMCPRAPLERAVKRASPTHGASGCGGRLVHPRRCEELYRKVQGGAGIGSCACGKTGCRLLGMPVAVWRLQRQRGS